MSTDIAEKKEVYTFQVLAGEHQGNLRKYVKGDTFRSQYPLDTMFTGKFQRLPNAPLPVDEAPVEKTRPRTAAADDIYPHIPNNQLKDMMPFSFTEAADVTHLFPTAKVVGLSVYKDALGGYAVAEAEAKVKTNLADQILGSKKKVSEFLADFAPSDKAD